MGKSSLLKRPKNPLPWGRKRSPFGRREQKRRRRDCLRRKNRPRHSLWDAQKHKNTLSPICLFSQGKTLFFLNKSFI